MQNGYRSHYLRDDRRRRLRGRSNSYPGATATLEELDNGVALIRIQAAQLVFYVETGLAAQIN
jgi:hypothetical protein